MAKYRKKPELGSVYVPGVGRVTDDRVLEGDLAKFVPALLVEVSDAPAPAPTRAPEPATKKSEPTMVMPADKQAELVAETVVPEPTKQMDAADLADLQSSEKAAAQQQKAASKKAKK